MNISSVLHEMHQLENLQRGLIFSGYHIIAETSTQVVTPPSLVKKGTQYNAKAYKWLDDIQNPITMALQYWPEKLPTNASKTIYAVRTKYPIT